LATFTTGLHWVFECSKHGKLVALVIKKEKQEGEKNISLILILSVIWPKVGEQPGGRMYVESKFEGKKLQGMMESRRHHVYGEGLCWWD